MAGAAQDAAVDGAQGNTCPGRVSSHGSVALSASTRMVWDRSPAEIPVVTPSRASTDTEWAVCLRSLVDGRHRGQVEAVELFARHGHTHDPGSMSDHEADQFRGGLARSEDQIALILAVGVVDDDHGPTGGDGFDRGGHRISSTC